MVKSRTNALKVSMVTNERLEMDSLCEMKLICRNFGKKFLPFLSGKRKAVLIR